ncbi:MAG: 50S ribosomal protein L1 [bacterium]|nr:50S ribosomal protein L1 [bacterium]
MKKKVLHKKVKKHLSGVDLMKSYTIQEAIDLAKNLSKEKFDASLEVHLKTGIDAKKSDQSIRGSVVLPHGTGKTKRVAVFAEGEKATEATSAGADLVGGLELIQEIKSSGKADFDVAIATPDMMKNLAGVAKILGPKGLMPSPKNETVTVHIKGAIEAVKKGKVNFKNDDSGNVHQSIGKRSFDTQKLIENYTIFMESVRKARPSTAKGTYLKTVTLSTTMGPGIKVTTAA